MIGTPAIPNFVTVHLGTPSQDAEDITLPFLDYITNVACSEVYPTWPEEALKANIYAEISVVMNRIYTRYYRSLGYAFDITASTAYDQAFVYQRDIFENVAAVVSRIFNSYIRRRGNVEPLFAQFCDGIRVTCDGLSQWGSVSLAEQGKSAEEILKTYYGNDIEIVSNVPIRNQPDDLAVLPLREGDIGSEVQILQRRLNRIAVNYPGIPKILPADGFFNRQTTNAVLTFQNVFQLTQDGIVGRETWLSVQAIYNAVKRLYELNSEGLKLSELQTQYESSLQIGNRSIGVLFLQYYLAYISAYNPTVKTVTLDGDFGAQTRASVISFQKAYGLPTTGTVDRETWNRLQSVYYSLISDIPFEYREGVAVPYPGRILYNGSRGDDVMLLQQYLAYIGKEYPSIPSPVADGIFGDRTEEAVRAFIRQFGLADTNGRVGAIVWNDIVSVYEDLYAQNHVRNDQYPGYDLNS